MCHRPAAWPQVRASWYRGGHEAVDVVEPVARPVARAAVGTQECTQIRENDLLEPFWGICVHCCDVSCDASCVRWHECPNHHGAPAVPPR